ncbi:MULTISPECIES: ATP-binding protein [unclassified Saccharopolyspora]|uniref:ATP-binding protein n=1 Tax=unclassified Saccharopolyspora TaxID=2646250 RepID=UPI001CD195EE|nr:MULTISPECIES: AAA family ATPase [unclassified Saccharopolyspora]MCA1187288.1 AAA family ATPase [Saccharopolyspora sp. 6T]MCA1281472.1 AAA family ATPase [Saccharopolyspora sp. 7B]
MSGELWERLRAVEHRVRLALDARADPDRDDPYRGLYLTEEMVRRVLESPSASWSAEPGEVAEPGARLARLVADFGLAAWDVEFLLIALAPELDARFERLYGYLNDDVTRRRATPGMVLELCGMPTAGAGRFRFAPEAPLVAGGLLEVQEPERPLLTRTLRVPDRVVAHLLGGDEPDPAVRGLARVVDEPVAEPAELVKRLATGLDAGIGAVHLRGAAGAEQQAVDALAVSGRAALVLDAAALDAEAEPPVAELVREARLRRAGLVFGPLESSSRPESARLLRRLLDESARIPLLLHGSGGWDPAWARQAPLSLTSPEPDRAALWHRALAEAGAGDVDVEPLSAYRLGADQVRRAASVATRLARFEGRPLDADHLRAGVRAQNGAGLERLARRITPGVSWEDLVLPERTTRALAELSVRARHRDRVLGDWRMRPGGGRGRGVVALFAGESGTGKTMSAEVVAADLGMELYVVDLSTVVDKYVGETEKNLERIFTEAAGVNGVLLFDEADAIFGKRSQVKDAHDRYANVESAYLLQRMESFDGIAVLTTNLRANLDEAFTRRLDVIADFPVPEAEQRRALWDRTLGAELPRADDLDLDRCAERFELAGGSIRACAVTAAYLAAEAGRPVTTADLLTAIRQEYAKLGRLALDAEFE